VATPIAGEHPLTLYWDKREIVTLMTLGQAPEALAIGYLRNQRLLKSIEEIEAVQVDWETASVAVTTRKPIKSLKEKLKKRTVTTGCGQGTVFGDLMAENRFGHSCATTYRSRGRAARPPRGRPPRGDRLQSAGRGARLRPGGKHGRSGEDPVFRRGRRPATTRWTRSPAGCGSTAWTDRTRSSTPPGGSPRRW